MDKTLIRDLWVRITRSTHRSNKYILQTVVNLLQNEVSRHVYMRLFKSLRYIPNSFLWLFRKKEMLVRVKCASPGNVEDILYNELDNYKKGNTEITQTEKEEVGTA